MEATANLTDKLITGLTKTVSETVSDKNTAKTVGSGSLDVYATPMMIARMEEAAANLAEENLPEGYTSVGILMNVAHTAATPQPQPCLQRWKERSLPLKSRQRMRQGR